MVRTRVFTSGTTILINTSNRLQLEQMNLRPILSFLDLSAKICNSLSCDESREILRDVRHTLGAIGTWTNDVKMALKKTERVLES